MQNYYKHISVLMLAVAAILVSVAMVRHFSVLASDDYVVAKAIEKSDDSDNADSANRKNKKNPIIEKLKKKNMFFIPPKPGMPIVESIFGDKAYYNGRGFKVGETVGPGAKIVEITPLYVKLDRDGEEIKQYPIDAPSPSVKVEKKPESKKEESKHPDRESTKRQEPVMVSRVSDKSSQVDDYIAQMDVPHHLKDYLRQLKSTVSQERWDSAMRQWEEAPQSRRDEMIRELQEMYDSGEMPH